MLKCIRKTLLVVLWTIGSLIIVTKVLHENRFSYLEKQICKLTSYSQQHIYLSTSQNRNFFCFFVFFFGGGSFAFPSYISGVHHFWMRFLRMWPFFNPTIKVVTFRLRGWCVLGVFLLPAFTRLRTWTSGSFESVRWNACMHRLDLGLYSHPKEFWGEWSLNPC